MKPEKNHVTV